MIDLHSHILPGIDDGAKTIEISLAMARIAVLDGTSIMVCTPHFIPGVYANSVESIARDCQQLQAVLNAENIPLTLRSGADVALSGNLLDALKQGLVPTLNGGRYFLLEPPHHVEPARFKEAVLDIIAAGFIPIITHPERLNWVRSRYPLFRELVVAGAWLQITAGSLSGLFGVQARDLAMRMLREGLVHLIATDAHSDKRRVPKLRHAAQLAGKMLGEEESQQLVYGRPSAALEDRLPASVKAVPYLATSSNMARAWRSLRARYAH